MATNPAETTAPDAISRGEVIARTLRDEILSGQYRPGERLPSERDLALRFSTGRGLVREALRRLDQLGIASIQPGGARVVGIEHCTLDVLGPLLDLDELPDPELVEEVLQVFGFLMRLTAKTALRKATAEQMTEIRRRAALLAESDSDEFARHLARRQFADYLVEVADHLVLRLILNGLKTTFFARIRKRGIRLRMNNETMTELASELCAALDAGDNERVGIAMENLHRFFRKSVRNALDALHKERNSANA